MGTRAIVAYPYRNGYRGAWVWCDATPSNLGSRLRLHVKTLEDVKRFVKFGDISCVMSKRECVRFTEQFPNTDFICCKSFDTESALEDFLITNKQYKEKDVKKLKSGMCLLCSNDNKDKSSNNRYYITSFNQSLYILQQPHNIVYADRSDINFVYYKTIDDMRKQDINYVYVFVDGKWTTIK